MDRRQRKTREAIFAAFTTLISKKAYDKITVNDIIDEADIGRATFYAHFETKDYLMRELCSELFGHIIDTSIGSADGVGVCDLKNSGDSVFLHLLRHIKANDRNILTLLSSGNNELFMRYFRAELKRLFRESIDKKRKPTQCELPNDYVPDIITAAFAETVRWWIGGKLTYSAEQVNRYFETVIGSVIELDPSTQSCS